jgi:hypothetical protein
LQDSTRIKSKRSIFRADAARRYLQRQEEAILPRFISPHTFVCLWILAGLLVAGGFVVWLARMPVYAPGVAVIVENNGLIRDVNDDVVLVAFLPPQNLSQLRIGQRLYLQFTPTDERLSRVIVAVEPRVISPAKAQGRYGLGSGAAQAVIRPSAVAIARLEPLPADSVAATHVGSVYQVDVEIGSCRALSLLPLIGRFFE